MVRKHIFFSGNVQGVGFRYLSFYIAQSLGLTGWVENLWDGDGSAGKRSFHSGNVSSDSAAEMDQRDEYGDHRDSL